MIRRWSAGLARLGLGVLVGIAFFLLAAALGGLVPRPLQSTAEAPPAGSGVDIALLFGPIHVDLVLPANARTRAALAAFAEAGVPINDPSVAHFILGWGARDFYTSTGTFAEISFGATWRAITGDASVLRADVAGPLPPDLDLPTLTLSEAQYGRLLDAIASTATGTALPISGHTPTDGFVGAEGRFHIFRTCNTWVSDMLAAAGLRAGLWTPTPYSLRLALWRDGLS